MKIVLHLDEVPIQLDTDMLQQTALDHAAGAFENMARDERAKALRFGLKGVAKLFMEWVRFQARLGKLPPPDDALLKADVLSYTVRYWVAIILASLASIPWKIEYSEYPDGTVEVTGLVAADEPAAVSGAHPGSTDLDRIEAPDGGESEGLYPDPAGGSVGGSRDIGQWQDNLGQALSVGTLESLAG